MRGDLDGTSLTTRLRVFAMRVRGLFDRARTDAELAEEIASVIDLHAADLIRRGVAPDEAWRRARVKFGGVAATREAHRDRRGFAALDALWQDTRAAWRTLRARPAFTALCVLTLAVGLGAATAMFAILDGVVLRPLPFRDPDRLVVVHEIVPGLRDRFPLMTVSAGHFVKWRAVLPAFEASAAIELASEDLTGAGEPERLGSARATTDLFDLLGVPAQIGRTFRGEDGRAGHDDVVVISDGLWRRRFNADPGIVGHTIHLDARPLTVIGVAPATFRLPAQAELGVLVGRRARTVDVYRPLTFTAAQLAYPGMYNYAVIARLRDGWTPPQALAALNAVQREIAETTNAPRGLQASISPLRAFMARDVRGGLSLLMTAVGVVLVIICVNLANLLLARNARRRAELATRAALGGGRGRLLRQLLAESVLIAIGGGLLGLLGARLGLRTLLALAPLDLPRVTEIAIDARVALFALVLALIAGLAFGLLPALRLYGASIADLLNGGDGSSAVGGSPRDGARLRTLLIAGQMALCTVLLVSCGLLLASFVRLMSQDKGFEVTHRLSLDLLLPLARYDSPRAFVRFHDRLLPALRALPGVQQAALIETAPLGMTPNVNLVTRPGDVRAKFERPSAQFTFVSPDYFSTVGIPLLRGRLFDEHDRPRPSARPGPGLPRGRRVAVVSAQAARTLWPGENPLGQTFHEGDHTDPLTEVIGIVADIRGARLERDAGPTIYTPHWQRLYPETSIVMLTTLPAATLAAAIREEVQRLDPDLPAPAVRPLEDVVTAATADRRFQLRVVTWFSAAAVLLASLGIFGVVSHLVAQRTREIGLRMALGAQSRDLRRLVLGDALRPIAIGLAAGAAMALAAGHALRALLFGVSPFDPRILAAAIAPLLICAFIACYLPARRATRIDPLRALRTE